MTHSEWWPAKLPPPRTTPSVITPFLAAVRGSVRVIIVKKTINVRIKKTEKHVLYPILKTLKSIKTSPLLDIVKID